MTTRWIGRLVQYAMTIAAAVGLVNSGYAQFALQLDANGYVELPYDIVMNTSDAATIEYWARATPGATTGAIVWDRYEAYAEHKTLAVFEDGSIEYRYAGSPWDQPPSLGGAPKTAAGSVPFDAAWHHVAFVRRGDGRWEVYVDGASVLAMGPGTGLGNGCWLTCGVINGTPPTRIYAGANGAGWQIDELRVSSIERYTSSFVPAQHFIPDAATAMLLHFDEGVGSQTFDSGAAAQIGSVTGSYQWVLGLSSCVDPASCCTGGPAPYCTAKVNSQNCTPSIGFAGTTSISGPDDFAITASSVLNNKTGMFLWGTQPVALPFYGGTLCLHQPIRRTYHQLSGGNVGADDCSGTFSFIFSHAYSAQQQLAAGQMIYAQYWYRDPGYPAGYNVGLTGGLVFALCP